VFLEQAANEGATGSALEFLMGFNAQRFAGQIAAYEHGGLRGRAIDLSRDGRWVASAGKTEVVVWDASTGARRHSFVGHGNDVRAVRFDASAQQLVTASNDRTIKVWEIETGKLLHTFDQGAGVEWVEVHGDDVLAVGDSGTAKVWDLRTGKARLSLEGHKDRVQRATFGPGGEQIATAGFDGTVRLWRARDGKPEATIWAHEGRVSQIQWSPDGRILASAGFDDGRVRLWDVATRKQLREIKHRAEVRTIAFDKTGTRLVTGSVDRSAKVVAIDGTELFTLETGSPIMFAAFTPDAKRIVTACEDGSVRTWRADTAQPIWSFLGHDEAVWQAVFDASGTRLAASSLDGIPRVWDITYTGTTSLVGHTGNVWSSAFSADGKHVVTTAADGTAKVWEVGGKLVTTIEAGTTEFGMAAFSPSGKQLAIAGPGGASVYDLAGTRLVTFEGERRVTYLAYDRSGSRIVTAGESGSLKLWDGSTGKPVRWLDGHKESIWYVTFSADGKTIATASVDRTARTWDAETGKQRSTFVHPLDVSSVDLSADGKWLVSGGEDRLVRIWNLATGKPDVTLEGHMAMVSTVGFNPSGAMIVTSGHDGTVRLWDRDARAQLATVDAQTGLFLSAHFSPDGRRLVATSGQGRVNLWSISDRAQRAEIEHLVRCRVPARLRRSDSRPCSSHNALIVQPRIK
jgi:WD40 repeat protein